jgi:hypothetical protein
MPAVFDVHPFRSGGAHPPLDHGLRACEEQSDRSRSGEVETLTLSKFMRSKSCFGCEEVLYACDLRRNTRFPYRSTSAISLFRCRSIALRAIDELRFFNAEMIFW